MKSCIMKLMITHFVTHLNNINCIFFVVGYIAELIELPGLLGMMAAGLILRNVPCIDVAKDFDLSVSSPLRLVQVYLNTLS